MTEKCKERNVTLQLRYLSLAVLAFISLDDLARAEVVDRPPLGHLREASVPATNSPPIIDGILDDVVWKRATLLGSFWVSGIDKRPSEKTEVLVTSNSTHLFIAFKAYDNQPNKIEALQIRPDRGLGRDDSVTVELDPFLNYSQVSRFSVNASGTMTSFIGGGRVDQEDWKGNWTASVSRTDFGWVAEISIPYAILNFSQGAAKMGVNFIRYHHRTEEQSFWADVTRNFLPEERGKLVNLAPMEKEQKSSDFKFMPYLIAGHNIENRKGDRQSFVIDGGIDIRYTPSTDMTAMVSVRPDFSQIQSSVQNIAFSYNAKMIADNRPFFIEGSGYFGNNFYSSLIPDFDYAAKIFGNAGSHSYGALIVQSGQFENRTDIVAQDGYQINPTDNISVGFAGTKLPFETAYSVNFDYTGKTENDLDFEVAGVQSNADGRSASGGSYLANLGYQNGDWNVSTGANLTTRNFYLSNGYVPEDSLGTYGGDASVSYRHEFTDGPYRQISASFGTYDQQTFAGQLQSDGVNAATSVEFRDPQIRLSLSGAAGRYRPCSPSIMLDQFCEPGVFEDYLNDDRTITTGIAGGTRSSWFSWGVNYTTGMMGGENYEYLAGNMFIKPTETTLISLIPEWRPDNSEEQLVINGSWNINSTNTVGVRFIVGSVVQGQRLVYDWHIRRDLDLYAVASREPRIFSAGETPVMDTQFSIKLVATY